MNKFELEAQIEGASDSKEAIERTGRDLEELSEKLDDLEKPRRYEIVNAETGEPAQGVSFLLTPTGEEMHMLTEPGHYVGPMQDIGVYYHGHLTNEETGANSLPAIKPMALFWMAHRIIRELSELHTGEHRRYGDMKRVEELGWLALRRYEKYREENAEFVAEKEREEEERRAEYRQMSGKEDG